MRAIAKSRRAVREALAHEGWRFSLASSVEAFNHHRNSCRTLTLPAGSESDNRLRTIREALLRPLPWDIRRQASSRWLSYVSKGARRRMQPHLPVAAEFCLAHGFVFLVADVWAERTAGRWRIHREGAPAVLLQDRELYFWRGWQVSREALTDRPTARRILAEGNQTHHEVLLQRMGVETFVAEAGLQPVDAFRDSVLLKVDTAEKRSRWRNGVWQDALSRWRF